MKIRKEENYFPSSNNIDECYVLSYLPEGEPKGYIQIVHDTYEHIGIYEDVMKTYAHEGYICFGHDHIGHGKSVKKVEDLGKMEMKNGMVGLLEDVQRAFLTIFIKHTPKKKETFSVSIKEGERMFAKEKKVEQVKPPIHALIGVGFGSTLARLYPISFVDVNCVVLCGDPGFPYFNQSKLKKIEKEILKKGKDASAEEIIKEHEKLYSRSFDKNERFVWRTTDKTKLNEYFKDKLCQFEYTLNAYKLIVETELALSINQWAQAYPMYLTTYIISGDKDPVNKETKELQKMIGFMKRCDIKNIFSKFYEGGHQLFAETGRREVYSDILHIINAVKNQQYK